jgi:antitoxin PrlF
MYKATMTSKGQLTVPKAVRERLGLEPGDYVLFEIEADSATLKPLRRHSIQSLFDSLTGATLPYAGGEAERAAARKAAGERVTGERQ